MDSDRRGQWLRGVLDICVLALLADRESYGYQLAQALDASGVGPIQGGTLYPVLLRLQKTGLVTAQWREGSAGPARKYYRLTDDGTRRSARRQRLARLRPAGERHRHEGGHPVNADDWLRTLTAELHQRRVAPDAARHVVAEAATHLRDGGGDPWVVFGPPQQYAGAVVESIGTAPDHAPDRSGCTRRASPSGTGDEQFCGTPR